MDCTIDENERPKGSDMCFSAEASFTAAASLIPAGGLSVYLAYRTDRRFVPLCTLPLLFGVQQLFEGFVWTSGAAGDLQAVQGFSAAYMFFSWLAWPVWIPFSIYFVEPVKRKPFYLVASIIGGILGAGLFLPYLVHPDWLTVKLLDNIIIYGGVELFDFIAGRNLTYAAYLALIILPALLATRREVRVFGVLIAIATMTTYAFFSYAYISIFCFLGALMSFYLVFMIYRIRSLPQDTIHPDSIPT